MNTIIRLDESSSSIQYLCQKDKRLAKVISMIGPITYEPYRNSPYSFLVHEIIEQMLSIKAGAKIYSRLEKLCCGNVSPESIITLSEEQIMSTGTSRAKANYILGITNSIKNGELNLNELETLSDQEIIKTLTKQRGIGNWTAKMYLIFVLNRQDVLPFEDVAFLQAYSWLYKTSDLTPKSVINKCKKWKPYSSIATRYMYRALDTGLTKKEFHLYK